MDIPVYLFTGFLEAGKTRLITETLQDGSFNAGEPTLIIACEEGEIEYTPDDFPGDNVTLVTLERIEQVNPDKLAALVNKYRPSRILVEYNGMWLLDALYNALPKNCMVYQEIFLADAASFLSYNANMRTLVVDKLQSCELVVFNRFTPDMDKMEFHKIVRGISRKATIAYENGDDIQYDDIEDPLPYDITQDSFSISDEDYAIFYRDLSEDMEKYHKKTVTFKGLVARDDSLGDTGLVIGRHVMTCCEADIAYKGIACVSEKTLFAAHGSFQTVTAVIQIEKHKIYRSKGPVLHILSISPAEKPEKEVATFY